MTVSRWRIGTSDASIEARPLSLLKEARAWAPTDFRLQAGDDAVVVAESLGELRPLTLQHE